MSSTSRWFLKPAGAPFRRGNYPEACARCGGGCSPASPATRADGFPGAEIVWSVRISVWLLCLLALLRLVTTRLSLLFMGHSENVLLELFVMFASGKLLMGRAVAHVKAQQESPA
jgi:hypothetical protein